MDEGYSIDIDSLGNIYSVGYFRDSTDFNPGLGIDMRQSNGWEDIYIQKLNPAGEFEWVHTFGDFGIDKGNAVAVDPEGFVYMAGSFQGSVNFDPGQSGTHLTSNGYSDIFLAKFDLQGNFIWAKRFGGSFKDEALDVVLDFSGNIYITGMIQGSVDFDPGNNEWVHVVRGHFVLKLDSNGAFQWVKAISSDHDISGKALTIDTSGNILSTGHFLGEVDFNPGPDSLIVFSKASDELFVLNLKPNGQFNWVFTAGANPFTACSCYMYGRDIGSDLNGNIYVTGNFADTITFDPNNPTNTIISTGFSDIFLLKLNSLGDLVWANSTGGNSFDSGTSLSIDNQGNVYSTGGFIGQVDFDPSSNQSILTGWGEDVFLQKTSTNGDFIWAVRAGSNFSDYGKSVQIDDLGNIYLTGNFSGSADFDPSGLTHTLNSNGVKDAFILKLNDPAIHLDEISFIPQVKIYPNPNSGDFNIEIDEEIKNAKILITDILGRIVFSKSYKKLSKTEIKLNVTPGIYLINISRGDGINKTIRFEIN